MDCVTSKLVHPTMHPPNKHITINGVTKFMNKYGLQLVLYETTTIYKTQIDHIWTNVLIQQCHFWIN